jgi:hypothetical protein
MPARSLPKVERAQAIVPPAGARVWPRTRNSVRLKLLASRASRVGGLRAPGRNLSAGPVQNILRRLGRIQKSRTGAPAVRPAWTSAIPTKGWRGRSGAGSACAARGTKRTLRFLSLLVAKAFS